MFKDPARQRAYLKAWREKNPRYHSNYYWTQVKPLTRPRHQRRKNEPGAAPAPITGSAMSSIVTHA